MSENNDTDNLKMEAPASGISVRMYNPGFGDCFLLAFRAEDDSPRYILIDCGVHHQYKEAEVRKQRLHLLAQDIAEATGNHLDIVAVTHEHTDHLYGFKYARDEFSEIKIDELWLAWTEDPNDPAAQELKKRYGIRIRALAAASKRLEEVESPIADTIQGLPSYEGDDVLGAAGNRGNADQLKFLREQSKKKLVHPEDYRRPGEAPLTLPDVPGVKVYVLGPPKSVKWIRSLERKSELYPEMADMNATMAFSAAALGLAGVDSLDGDDRAYYMHSLPFDDSFGIMDKELESESDSPYASFFREHYGFSEQKEDFPWRRIETDWLRSAEQLALSLDSKTNNTSLVLAFELTQTQPKKVLLFVGDAQVGNWLSWHEVSWPGKNEADPPITAEELLHRTVLYKTGHHGSHNATPREKGLEMMTSSDLVAMIPVDKDWADEAMGWEHPAEKVIERLVEKTHGRVIRSDEIPTGIEPPQKPDEASESEWATFTEQLDWDKGPNRLWIQYTVTG
jgi:hypothetical protein